jgi:hypothetical protein
VVFGGRVAQVSRTSFIDEGVPRVSRISRRGASYDSLAGGTGGQIISGGSAKCHIQSRSVRLIGFTNRRGFPESLAFPSLLSARLRQQQVWQFSPLYIHATEGRGLEHDGREYAPPLRLWLTLQIDFCAIFFVW